MSEHPTDPEAERAPEADGVVDVDARAGVADLTERVGTVEEVLTGLVDTLTGRGGASPWSWEVLDAEAAAQLWTQLAEFVAFLSGRYLRHLPAQPVAGARLATVPGCWYRHPVAVELLTALMVAHEGAYGDPGAEPGPQLVDFHERSLWPTLERLHSLGVFKGCTDGHPEQKVERWSTETSTGWEPDDEFAAFVGDATAADR